MKMVLEIATCPMFPICIVTPQIGGIGNVDDDVVWVYNIFSWFDLPKVQLM